MSTAQDRRMDRVIGTLSAGERAAHSLRRWKEGRYPDRKLAATVPDEERSEYIDLLNMIRVANGEIALLLLALEARVQAVERTLGWAQTIEAMRLLVATCAETRLTNAAREVVADGRRFVGGLDDESEGARARVMGLMRADLCAAWLEHRAIEGGLSTLKRALGGEHPLGEEHLARLEACRARLEAVHAEAEELAGEIELPEPDKEQAKLAMDLLKSR